MVTGGAVGLQDQGGVIGGQGLVKPLQPRQQGAPLGQDLRALRQRMVGGQGLGQPPLGRQGAGAVGEGEAQVGGELQGLIKEGQPPGQIPQLHPAGAEAGQQVGVVGPALIEPLIEWQGSGGIASLMQGQGLGITGVLLRIGVMSNSKHGGPRC